MREPLSLEVPLRCQCGAVRGVASNVAASAGLRFVCYCKDCQAFARFLERPEILNVAGGTDLFQMPMGRVNLSAGMDALRCVSFSGSVLRWYTGCCRTPIGNTAGPRFPVIGLVHSFCDHAAIGHSRDSAFGPALCRLYENSATGPLPADAAAPPSFRLFARRVRMLFGWWVHGLGRPNAFFHDRTGAPRSIPRILDQSEAAALRLADRR